MRWEPDEIVSKAKKEAEEWFLAQVVEEEQKKKEHDSAAKEQRKWMPPPNGWLMCNITFEWCKAKKLTGAAWVVRNHRGVVMCHNRRAFSGVENLEEARYTILMWAVESMTNMHFNKIIFEGDFKELFLALENPHKWPRLSFQVQEIQVLLNSMEEFLTRKVRAEENRGATFIAQSVTRQERLQSYVARSYPDWLFELFVNESRFL